MPYSTQSDLESVISSEKLRQLTDDARDGQSDAAVITKAITDADGIIDSYVGARYATPVSPVPSVLAAHSATIALYRLFLRRSIAPPESIKSLYEQTMEFLKMVSESKTVIAGVNTNEIFATNKVFAKDRLHRLPESAGKTDAEKAGTFGTFDQPFRFF